MRITVNIDDDVLAIARALAKQRRTSLGKALSELARRGFESDGTVFAVAADAVPITNEDVYGALGEWP